MSINALVFKEGLQLSWAYNLVAHRHPYSGIRMEKAYDYHFNYSIILASFKIFDIQEWK